MFNKIFLVLISLILIISCSLKKDLGFTYKIKNTTLVTESKLKSGLSVFQYKLENGLTVVLIPNPRAPYISLYHWVKIGSIHETPGITGIAHLFEHMMFRPLSEGKPGFFELASKGGASINANTRLTSTVYTSTFPKQHLEYMLEIESDRFKNLQVTDKLLDVERKAVHSEYSTGMDSNPSWDLWYYIYKIGFPDHPYGWHIIGFREDLEKIKAQDCNKFFLKFYKPNNIGLFISGDIDPNKTLDLIVKYYSNWGQGEETKPPKPFKGERKFIFGNGKLKQSSKVIIAGYRIPEYNNKNHHLLNIINYIFYDSDFSLADRRLYYGNQFVSNLRSHNFDYDEGMLKVKLWILPKFAISKIINELINLTDDFKKLPEDEFMAYLKNYQIQVAETLLRNEDIVSLLSLSWGKWGDIDYIVSESLKSVPLKKEEIVKFIDKYLVRENMVVVAGKDEPLD